MEFEAISSVQGKSNTDAMASREVEKQSVVDLVGAVDLADVSQNADTSQDKEQGEEQGKAPSENTIHSVMSEINQRSRGTRCEYGYDDLTKRVTIKVYDKDSDKLIREIPPEESLKVLQKIWELAGLIVDERR